MSGTFLFISKVILLIIIIIFLSSDTAFASNNQNFRDYMNTWNEKIKLASEYLDKAENELKNGDAIQGCINQKKAGSLGVEASKSLIKAFELNSASKGEIENLENGLNKWKEFRDFC